MLYSRTGFPTRAHLWRWVLLRACLTATLILGVAHVISIFPRTQYDPVREDALPSFTELAPQLQTIPQRIRVLGYSRNEFGQGWAPALTSQGSCSTREYMLEAQFGAASLEGCRLRHAPGKDPYSALEFRDTTIDMDHIYPLRAAWDMGAYAWDENKRRHFANDPINLIGTTALLNREKSDLLPGEWMPPDKHAGCWYARRIALIALRYELPLSIRDVRAMRWACVLE